MDLFKKYVALNFFIAMGSTLFLPVIGPYLKSLGISDGQLGLISSVMPLALIITLPFIGSLADKSGKRKLILYSMLLSMIGLYLYLSQTHIVFIIIARFIEAVAGTTVILLVLARMEDLIPNKHRGERSGFYLSIGSIPGIIFPLVGGVLADKYFMQFPLYVSLLIFGITLIVYLFTPEPKEKKVKIPSNWWLSIRQFLADPKLLLITFLGMAAHATQPLTTLFLAIYVVEELGLTFTAVGLLLVIPQFMHLFQGLLGKMGDRYGHHHFICGGLFLTALSFLAMGFAHSFLYLAITMFFLGIGGSAWNVNAWALMSTIGEQKNREGVVTHAYVALAKIGGFVGFVTSGFIYGAAGFGGLAIVFGTLLILVSTPTYFAYQKLF